MAAEHYPTPLVSRLANTGPVPTAPQGYYRSKLFITPSTTNTLLAAAGPIFSLLERLCLSPSLPPIAHIRENIEHELRAFTSKLIAAEYSSELMGTAQYLLSATIDEILGKSYLRIYNIAPEFNSFTPVTHDLVMPQQRFFEIVNHIQERPNQYLDLIELAYFCLVAGFEGEFHLKPGGRQMLDNHIEHLYQIIQQYRYNKPLRLFNENVIPKTTFEKSHKTTLFAIAIAIVIVTAAFLADQMLLDNKAKNVLSGHTQLATLDN